MATGRPNGRPPKPVEQKRALGNPGKRELPPAPMPGHGITAEIAVPKPPRELGKKGKELWNTLWVNGRNHLSLTDDLPIILMLCHAWDELEFIRQEFATGKVDKVYLMANGAYANHPYIAQRKELHAQCTAWLSMLGFSPTDRSRLGLSEVREASPLDEMAKRRAAREADNG